MLNLLVEIAAFVVSDEMRADVLVACSFCGRCLVLEAPKECLGDVLFEVHARILGHHSRPEIFGKRLVADTEHIQTDSVVQELHLQRFVCCDTGCCVESNGVPGRLDPSGGHTMMLEKLTSSIRTVYFKTIRRAAKRLEQPLPHGKLAPSGDVQSVLAVALSERRIDRRAMRCRRRSRTISVWNSTAPTW